MEGLEATELKLSEVWEENETKRFDPEFFKKDAQLAYSRLKHHRRFADLVKEGYRVIYENTESIEREEGIPLGLPFFLQAADLETPFIHDEGMACVAESDWERYPKGRIQPGEILIEVKGKAEKVAIVPDDFPPKTLVTGTCYKLQVKDPLDKHLLVSFLICRYGQALKERLKTNLLISFISKEDLYSLPVPQFGNDLKRKISEAFIKSQQIQRDSFKHQKEAEQTLLRALGLEGWEPPEPLTYTRRASEVLERGRYDAEHYQEQYYSLAAKLREYPGGVATLGELCPEPANGVEIREYAEEGVPYLRVGDIKNYTVSTSSLKYVAPEAAAREIEKVRLKIGDVLVSRSGSLAVTGVVEPEWVHAVISSHLILVRLADPDFKPHYVAAFLAAMPGKMQIIQHSNGGVQPEINQPSLKRVLVPRLPPAVQDELITQIRQAHQSRQSAQALLAKAKRAVEVAIEQGEEKALLSLM